MIVYGGHDLGRKTKFSEENFLPHLVMQFPGPHLLTLKNKKTSDVPIEPMSSTIAIGGDKLASDNLLHMF